MPTAGSLCAPPAEPFAAGRTEPAGAVPGRGFPAPPAAFAVPHRGRAPSGRGRRRRTDRPAALFRCPCRGAGCPLASTAAGAARVGRAAKTPAASGRARPSDQGGSAPSTAACARPSTVPRGCAQDGAAPGAGSAARGRAALGGTASAPRLIGSRRLRSGRTERRGPENPGAGSRRPRSGRTQVGAGSVRREPVPPPAAGRTGAAGTPASHERDFSGPGAVCAIVWLASGCPNGGAPPTRGRLALRAETGAGARGPQGAPGRPGAAGAARHGRAGRRRPSDRSPERRRRGQP